MSRRGRAQGPARRAKSWQWDDAGWASVAVALDLPNPTRPEPLRGEEGATLERRVLDLLGRGDEWTGDPSVGGLYTSRIASALGLRPHTPGRDALGETLTAMRKRGLLHYEFRRGLDREVRWWLVVPRGS